MNYLQCKFEKKILRAIRFYTAWIPEEKVKINKFFKLKIHGDWQDGWQLISKSNTRVNEDQLTFLKEKFTNNI